MPASDKGRRPSRSRMPTCLLFTRELRRRGRGEWPQCHARARAVYTQRAVCVRVGAHEARAAPAARRTRDSV